MRWDLNGWNWLAKWVLVFKASIGVGQAKSQSRWGKTIGRTELNSISGWGNREGVLFLIIQLFLYSGIEFYVQIEGINRESNACSWYICMSLTMTLT